VENELPWTASDVGIAKSPVGTTSAEVFIRAATTGGAKFQRSRSKEQEDSALAPDMEYGGFKTTRLRQQLLQNSKHPGAFEHQYVRLLSRLEEILGIEPPHFPLDTGEEGTCCTVETGTEGTRRHRAFLSTSRNFSATTRSKQRLFEKCSCSNSLLSQTYPHSTHHSQYIVYIYRPSCPVDPPIPPPQPESESAGTQIPPKRTPRSTKMSSSHTPKPISRPLSRPSNPHQACSSYGRPETPRVGQPDCWSEK
jgi:hypothetical protein